MFYVDEDSADLAILKRKVKNFLDFVANKYDVQNRWDFECPHVRSLAIETRWERTK